jgi:hypothetical protein
MRVKSALLCALAIWAATLAVALSLSPVKASNRLLFESIMPVALTAATVLAMAFYYRRRPASAAEGAAVGAVALAVNLALDGAMFASAPAPMDPLSYFQDIGVTYLLIPIVTAAMGWARGSGNRDLPEAPIGTH